jgi:hypothetical protein
VGSSGGGSACPALFLFLGSWLAGVRARLNLIASPFVLVRFVG